MKLTEQQRTEMLDAAKPLIKWMNENTHPMCFAVVDHRRVEVTETIAMELTDEFIERVNGKEVAGRVSEDNRIPEGLR